MGRNKEVMEVVRNMVRDHTEKLFDKCAKKVEEAINGSEKRRLTFKLDHEIDLSEANPAVSSIARFKDKDKESGMEVTKTFKTSETDVIEDPNQSQLFTGKNGGGEDKPKGRSRKAAAANDDTEAEEATA